MEVDLRPHDVTFVFFCGTEFTQNHVSKFFSLYMLRSVTFFVNHVFGLNSLELFWNAWTFLTLFHSESWKALKILQLQTHEFCGLCIATLEFETDIVLNAFDNFYKMQNWFWNLYIIKVWFSLITFYPYLQCSNDFPSMYVEKENEVE